MVKDEAFAVAVAHTLEAEGVFSDHSWDPGGRTKYGITEALARAYGYDDVAALTVPQATEIYREEFWERLGLEEVAATSLRVAAEVFDTAANTGNRRATLIAQEALNEVFGHNLAMDGRMGPATRGALVATARRYEQQLVAALNGFQFAYYLWLKRRGHRAAEQAIRGWMRRLETPLA